MAVAEKDLRNRSDIFPKGQVIYFLRKCDILLSQCDVCPQGGILWYPFGMIKIIKGYAAK